jgi:hypothetical protein
LLFIYWLTCAKRAGYRQLLGFSTRLAWASNHLSTSIPYNSRASAEQQQHRHRAQNRGREIAARSGGTLLVILEEMRS